MDFLKLADLTVSLDQLPHSNKILDYFAILRTPVKMQDQLISELKRHLQLRTPFAEVQRKVSGFSWSPNDSGIFNHRFKLVIDNNRAYSLLQKPDASVSEIEELSEEDPCWSTLFPIKGYLGHHIEKARRYRGMVPFGQYVIKVYNEITDGYPEVKSPPTYRDHERLREITNLIADRYHIPSIAVNDLMYNEGREWAGKEKQAKKNP